jgi:hypothetical protein
VIEMSGFMTMPSGRALTRWLLASTLVLAARGSFAQEAEEEAPESAEPGEGATEGVAKKGKKGGAEGEPQVSETHTVQSGDTLWDLCTKYLNSPWYWPKIWSYNPQITNPHWIFPGNELRFYPSDENAPVNVENTSNEMAIDEGKDESPNPEAVEPEDLVRSVGSVQVGKVPQDSIFTSHYGFVEAKDHDVAGQLQNATSEAQQLIDFDLGYVKLKTAAKKGDQYAVYRTVKAIEHPITGEPYGYVVEVVGTVQVVDTSPTVASVEVQQAYRPIERGDFVGPVLEAAARRVNPTPATVEAKGYVIETLEAAQSEVAEFSIVFIDLGSSQGVQVGNVFSVLERGDRFTRETEGLPNEEVGKIMVINVQDKASTAVVIRSAHELGVGDKVEARKAI